LLFIPFINQERSWLTLGAIRSTGLTASRALAEFSAQKLFPEMMLKPEDMIKPLLEPMMPVPGFSHRDKMTAILFLIFATNHFYLSL